METTKTVGVVVARFQVPELHIGHRYLLEYVAKRHQNVLVGIGTSRTYPTRRDPLDFVSREVMVKGVCPEARVISIKDCRCDKRWSECLDRLICETFPGHKAVLYGSRESFITRYCGLCETYEVPPLPDISGTQLRKEVAEKLRDSVEFRAGIIYHVCRRPGISYPAVDVAIIDETKRLVLMCSKTEDGGKLRFVGGFVEPTDVSLEHAARRECYEETSNMEADGFSYLGSHLIPDWRYENADDRIISSFFVARYIFGKAEPADDVDGLQWVSYEEIARVLVPEHEHFGKLLIDYITKNKL